MKQDLEFKQAFISGWNCWQDKKRGRQDMSKWMLLLMRENHVTLYLKQDMIKLVLYSCLVSTTFTSSCHRVMIMLMKRQSISLVSVRMNKVWMCVLPVCSVSIQYMLQVFFFLSMACMRAWDEKSILVLSLCPSSDKVYCWVTRVSLIECCSK